ncbi:diguanylate cyclase [Parasulfuritortus cantonensis]|nr:diguanylate cyclase [Parasulfuritortus cantonensis]
MSRWLCLLAVTVLACFGVACAAPPRPVTIGVLAFRPKPETLARWQPTADYLAAQTRQPFRVLALTLPELEEAVRQQRLDFVLTNPGHYVYLTKHNALSSPLATLIELENGRPLTQFGGVVFVPAGRQDIAGLADLRGKRVAAAEVTSFGGYQMQAAELTRIGLSPVRDLDLLITGMPQDKAIYAVLEGRADAGFVRTGVLEALAARGVLQLSQIRVVNPHPAPGFPFLVSTRLYPEWPFAAMPATDEHLAQAVAKALFSLAADNPAARAGHYHGWAIPTDYEPVRAMLQTLRLPPYDQAPAVRWSDVAEQHWLAIGVATAGGMTILFLSFMLAFRQRQLRDRDRRLAKERRQLLAALGEGVYGVDENGLCTFVNPAALALLGYTAEELLGNDQHALIHHHHADGRPYEAQLCPIHLTLQDGKTRHLDEWFIRKDGSGLPVHLIVTRMDAKDGRAGAVVAFHDISARQTAQARDRLLVSALDAAANAIVITDAQARIEWVNPAFEELTGYRRHEAVGHRPAELVKSGLQSQPFYAAMWQTILAGRVWRGEVVNKKRDGSLYDEELIIAPVTDDDGNISHFVGIKQDISERKRMEAELQALATTDSLTGLPNRRHFLSLIEQERARLQRFDEPPATLLMLDLDHFKQVNDNHGHAAGDAALRHFANLVRLNLRRTDLAGRLGGEEFAVLLFGTTPGGALEFAERLRSQTEADGIQFEGGHLHFTVSIGVAQLFPDDVNADVAMARADTALYKAKANGRNRVEAA